MRSLSAPLPPAQQVSAKASPRPPTLLAVLFIISPCVAFLVLKEIFPLTLGRFTGHGLTALDYQLRHLGGATCSPPSPTSPPPPCGRPSSADCSAPSHSQPLGTCQHTAAVTPERRSATSVLHGWGRLSRSEEVPRLALAVLDARPEVGRH